ncbi:MAG: prolipoprotein diacylglyceryl transferase, partial [Planctomycetota bacterium]
MYPVLFEIPDPRSMSGLALALEIAAGLGCLVAWGSLALRRRKGTVASTLSLGAFLVAAHLALSRVMDGPITIYSFGVVVIAGFFAGSSYILRQTRRLSLDDKKVFDFAFWMLVVGIVGSRLLYAFLNYDDFRANKWEVLKIWNGGLVWYGGLIPAVAVGVALLARYRMPVLAVCDIGIAGVMLALGIGRWACFLAGDDYGRPTDVAWAVKFYHPRCLVPEELRGVGLHPTQLYMSVKALWIFFLVDAVRRRARFAGTAFGATLILYAAARGLLIEPYRGDFAERNPGYRKHAALKISVEKGAD